MTSERSTDFERHAATAALVFLVVGCYLVIRPFLTAFLWGGILAVSTWGGYSRLLRRVRNRPAFAATLMVLGLCALLLVPLTLLALKFAEEWPGLTERGRSFVASGAFREPPRFVEQLPFAGKPAAEYWRSVAAEPGHLAQDLRPLLRPVREFLLAFSAGLGGGLLEFALALMIAGMLYVAGNDLGHALLQVAYRLGGESGRRQVAVVASTVRGVFRGVIGTAVAQALLAVIGFWIAGVPGIFLLGMLTALLSVVPAGPALLWAPAALWLYASGSTGWAVFMAVWGLFVVSGSDNVVRPLLIGKSVAAPLPLVFLGVVGGILAFGFLGLFIGPTLLAIAYNLFQDWISERSA